ncbi:MAG: YceD family protein [Burkholderiales bacterium]
MRAFMSGPAAIDSVEFARTGEQASGRIAVAGLERLRDLLFDATGTLDYTIDGGTDERGRPQLTVTVSGNVNLRCQRCLGRLPHAVRFTDTLLLGSGAEADAAVSEPDAPEWIPADQALDPVALVEDEVLLALPFAPRHAEGECGSSVKLPPAETAPQAAKPHPFAGLAAWKRRQ